MVPAEEEHHYDEYVPPLCAGCINPERVADSGRSGANCLAGRVLVRQSVAAL